MRLIKRRRACSGDTTYLLLARFFGPGLRLLPVLPCADFYHGRAGMSTEKGIARAARGGGSGVATTIKLCVPGIGQVVCPRNRSPESVRDDN